MEIAELNLISDFEAGIKCLQNPSLFSKLSSSTNLYGFCTFGALIITIFVTFTNIFNKIKTLINQTILSCKNSYPQQIFTTTNYEDDDFDFDFSDDGGDTPSSVADSDNDDEDDDGSDYDGCTDEVFRVEGNDGGYNGNLTLRRRNGFSWSDFSAGKSVVQLWDSFGLGLDFEDEDEDEIAIWDLNHDVKLSSGKRVKAATAEETVVLTAEKVVNGGVGFGTYDSRVDEKFPAVYATWRPRQRKVWFDGDGVCGEKVE